MAALVRGPLFLIPRPPPTPRPLLPARLPLVCSRFLDVGDVLPLWYKALDVGDVLPLWYKASIDPQMQLDELDDGGCDGLCLWQEEHGIGEYKTG